MTRSPPSHSLDRRAFLQLGGLAVAGTAAAACGGASPADSGAPDDACPLTGADQEGPFYREGAPERSDLDLYGDQGTPLELSGTVVDGDCSALAGAVLDLWQADPTGTYDNSSSDLRYRGRVVADADGRFSLRTLVPGYYSDGLVFRPLHIHLKVWVGDQERLTTQLYFEGDPHLRDAGGAPIMAVQEDSDGTWRCEVELAV